MVSAVAAYRRHDDFHSNVGTNASLENHNYNPYMNILLSHFISAADHKQLT